MYLRSDIPSAVFISKPLLQIHVGREHIVDKGVHQTLIASSPGSGGLLFDRLIYGHEPVKTSRW